MVTVLLDICSIIRIYTCTNGDCFIRVYLIIFYPNTFYYAGIMLDTFSYVLFSGSCEPEHFPLDSAYRLEIISALSE